VGIKEEPTMVAVSKSQIQCKAWIQRCGWGVLLVLKATVTPN